MGFYYIFAVTGYDGPKILSSDFCARARFRASPLPLVPRATIVKDHPRMLLEIAKLPTAENSAIHLHPDDNVAVARVLIAAGRELRIGDIRITTRDAIPAGHKVALRVPPAGADGAALRPGHRPRRPADRARPARPHPQPRLRGAGARLTSSPPMRHPCRSRRPGAPSFLGYAREDGRVGTRNYIAVVAASNCAAHTAETIARSFEDVRFPGQRRWRGRLPARRWLRPLHGPRCRSAPPHPGRRPRAPQRLRRDDPGARLRGQPDRPLPRPGRPRQQPPRRA